MPRPDSPLGFIADDITGATDLASALAGRGIDTRLVFGDAAMPADPGEAIVVALKIRSVPAAEARAAASRAAHALRAVGAEQLFSKYCSTFDSTAEGNIGPIADELAELSAARRVVHCPAYPTAGRTVYRGHLFVGDQLLSESPMRRHPLNPMRDSQLLRVLGPQTPHPVELVALPTLEAGTDAVAAQLADGSAPHGVRHVIADAVRDGDLDTIAGAIARDPVAAGSAAFGAAFAVAARALAGRRPGAESVRASVPPGPTAILAGSLSRATRRQVAEFDGVTLSLRLDDLLDGDAAVVRALDAASGSLALGPVLITTDYESTAEGAGIRPGELAGRIERTMGQIGAALVRLGVRRLIVAGGETSGAVADALSLRAARIGPDISVGVPWIVADQLAVAFKSGNFGGPTFFRDAMAVAGP